MKIIIDSPGIKKDCMDFEKYASMLQNKQLWKYFDNFLVEGIDTHDLEEYIHKSRTSYIEETSQFEK